MLSQVAERIYWMARYLERAENTARMITVYSHLLMDLPRRVRVGWQPLIIITGGKETYAQHYTTFSEKEVVDFLLSDVNNTSSILCAISWARENMRTIRDIVSNEAWERVNDLYLYTKESVVENITTHRSYAILADIISRCQQITGLLASTMPHDETYDFVCLGKNLERADMTTRIVDTGVVNTLEKTGKEHEPFGKVQWMSVLKSLDAYHAFRRYVHPQVTSRSVVSFLLQDQDFPRAITFCLERMMDCLKRLPRKEEAFDKTEEIHQYVRTADVSTLLDDGSLHQFIDEIQVELGIVHELTSNTWFGFDYLSQPVIGQSQSL